MPRQRARLHNYGVGTTTGNPLLTGTLGQRNRRPSIASTQAENRRKRHSTHNRNPPNLGPHTSDPRKRSDRESASNVQLILIRQRIKSPPESQNEDNRKHKRISRNKESHSPVTRNNYIRGQEHRRPPTLHDRTERRWMGGHPPTGSTTQLEPPP